MRRPRRCSGLQLDIFRVGRFNSCKCLISTECVSLNGDHIKTHCISRVAKPALRVAPVSVFQYGISAVDQSYTGLAYGTLGLGTPGINSTIAQRVLEDLGVVAACTTGFTVQFRV